MISIRAYKTGQNVLFLLTMIVLGASVYFQYVSHLEPCPLCLMQRFSGFLFAIFCIVGLCSSSLKWARVVLVIQMLIAMAGLFFASRQLWLQFFPSESSHSCMPDLDTMIRFFPWQDIARTLFWGTGHCAEVNWLWLGLSMPAWSALFFLGLLMFTALLFFFVNRSLHQWRARL